MMAKLLREVWKTFYGAFFETAEEAAEAERDYRTDAAIKQAYDDALAPLVKAHEERVAADNRLGGRPLHLPHPQSHFQLPPHFKTHLLAALKAQGVLAEPVLIKDTTT